MFQPDYKLCVFGIFIEGLVDTFYNNEFVFKTIAIPELVLSKKLHSISYHSCREDRSANHKGRCVHKNIDQQERTYWVVWDIYALKDSGKGVNQMVSMANI